MSTINDAVVAQPVFVRVGAVRRVLGGSVTRWIGMSLLLLIVLMCAFVPTLWSYGPNTIVAEGFLSPRLNHPFGTDAVGRDVFVRTFAGGRVDLLAAVFSTGFALIVGTLVGTFAGTTHYRWIDSVIMRITDAIRGFPLIILLLALVVVIGSDRSWGPTPPGLLSVLVALVIVQWTVYARLARGQALSLRESDFVVAARVSGLPQRRIVIRHVLPGVGRITAAYAVGDAVLVVVILASLPFIQAGVQPPAAEWGSIMFEGRAYLLTSWWITILPGVVLCLSGLALSLVADSLLDNRTRP
jgi:peptide/nickel transport system permease protein